MRVHLVKNVAILKRLVKQLERLDAGKVSAPDLMAKPVLKDWTHAVSIVSCLEGAIEGDATHSDGNDVRTGQLFAFFEDDGENFVLTLDGWYRLGSSRRSNAS
ncbi:hypothetical protein GFL91_04690 [Rhizobium leguminosarum bv. viciae]|uniref:Uncharacterized protein n=1 Tax=Rhizobium leguminosarum bv. viciae TaxID=387 RepID=A0A8I2GQ61_RHILV|nr:hypothetical protein [Rhizobium leguminosarum]NKM44297.1 hypothetical protein [Rhizobium leguminosarum bv. viciae]